MRCAACSRGMWSKPTASSIRDDLPYIGQMVSKRVAIHDSDKDAAEVWMSLTNIHLEINCL